MVVRETAKSACYTDFLCDSVKYYGAMDFHPKGHGSELQVGHVLFASNCVPTLF